MNKYLCLILLVISCSLAAEETGFRFLIENQELPEAIKLSYTDNLNEDNQILLDTYLWAKSNENQLLTVGFGAIHDQRDLNYYSHKELNGCYTNLFYTRQWGKNYFLTTYQSVGNFSENSIKFNLNEMKYYQITKLGFQLQKNLNVSAGILSSTNYNNPLITPVLSMTYSSNRFFMDLSLPLYLETIYHLNETLSFSNKVLMDTKSYRIQDNEKLQMDTFNSTLGINYKLFRQMGLTAEYTYYQKNTCFLQSNKSDKHQGSNYPSISFILRIKE